MSHAKQRSQKNCLNCNSLVAGHFCSVCGQENIVPRESFLNLLSHFFRDITHFDGKLFQTLRKLFFRPGLLTTEYLAGKRACYVNPIRLYVFTSFIFFLVFFSFFNDDGAININNTDPKAADKIDSANTKTAPKGLINIENYNDDGEAHGVFSDQSYRDKREYDSLRQAGAVHDNFFERMIAYRQIDLDKKYGRNNQRQGERFKEYLEHSLPQIFFICLPLLALMLKVLYIRRKQFFYVSHIIFALHLFTFIFLARLLGYLVSSVAKVPYLGWVAYLNLLVAGGIFYYCFRAMKNFYGQSAGKTFLKYLLLLISFIFIMLAAGAVMAIISFYKM